MTVTEFAAAKINLFLHVTGRRPDGYHKLETLAVFAGIGDTITAETSGNGDFSLKITGPFAPALERQDDNLVLKAARSVQAAMRSRQIDCPGANLGLTKNLPVASGIGGGSADAAATVRALMRLWPDAVTASQLPGIFESLGADLPMCFRSRSVIAKGTGDLLDDVELPTVSIVLVNPGVAVSTADIFRDLEIPKNPAPSIRPVVENASALAGWLRQTRNDLSGPAVRHAPVIGDALAAIRKTDNCLFAGMSGSGATCFGLFEDTGHAKAAALDLHSRYPQWWIEATQTLEANP